MKQIYSTEKEKWVETTTCEQSGEELKIGEAIGPAIYGFGGCFNEIGMKEIYGLEKEKQKEIFNELFSDQGLGFCYNRISIAANDYAEDWYSYNDVKGDYEMKNFSIERDKKYIIPAIKEAQAIRKDMAFFASPWSPPTWMKYPQACNYGKLVQTEENLKAYALYLKKFVEEYAKEDIKISHLYPQNEFMCDHKFPSCQYSADEMENLLLKLIDEIGDLCEIWLGTNCWYQFYSQLYGQILQNEKIRKAVSGAGFQWSATYEIGLFKEDYPELNAVQTECECGGGQNNWSHAIKVFEIYRRSFRNGANANVYWNMVLKKGGLSTWGWRQNSLFTIDEGEVIKNPEYYCVKHFSHFVKKGAVMLKTEGAHSSNSAVFKNTDGSIVAVVMNPYKNDKVITINKENYLLKAGSFNTILL